MASPEGLAPRHRIRGREGFSALIASGKRLHAAAVTLVMAPAETGVSRFGVSIGRRVSPKSTERNHLKRIAREVFRRHPAKLVGLDVVVLARPIKGGADPRLWARGLGELLDRAARAIRS